MFAELRPLGEKDVTEFLAAAQRSLEFHEKWGWGPPRTKEQFEALQSRAAAGRCTPLVVERTLDGVITGLILVRKRCRVAGDAGVLAYWAFVPWNGRGLMSAALTQLIDLAADEWHFTWLEACVDPANERSRRLLAGRGFRYQELLPRVFETERGQHVELWIRDLR